MYAKLIDFARERFSEKTSVIRDILRLKLRLCTCGSASLPDSVLEAWQDLTGHVLLERYGMSEFGMGLGNSLRESDRKVGSVGRPFPGIRVRIAEKDRYSRSGFKTLLEGVGYLNFLNSQSRYQGFLAPKGNSIVHPPEVAIHRIRGARLHSLPFLSRLVGAKSRTRYVNILLMENRNFRTNIS